MKTNRIPAGQVIKRLFNVRQLQLRESRIMTYLDFLTHDVKVLRHKEESSKVQVLRNTEISSDVATSPPTTAGELLAYIKLLQPKKETTHSSAVGQMIYNREVMLEFGSTQFLRTSIPSVNVDIFLTLSYISGDMWENTPDGSHWIVLMVEENERTLLHAPDIQNIFKVGTQQPSAIKMVAVYRIPPQGNQQPNLSETGKREHRVMFNLDRLDPTKHTLFITNAITQYAYAYRYIV